MSGTFANSLLSFLSPHFPFTSPHKSYYEKRGPETVCIDDEIPFEIPASWEWCRFSSILELISGRDLTPGEYSNELGTTPYLIGASNIINGQIDIIRWTNSPKVISKKGDILISVKGTIGEIVVNEVGDIHIARQFMAMREYTPIESGYYKIFLHSAIEHIKNAAKGIIPGISREDLLELLVPISSYLEQKRIIASVKNAYKYIGSLESNKFDLSAYIKQTKAKVLDLAIRGKLVPQDPTDEPASVLLERIKAEKEAATKPSKRGAKTSTTTSDNSHYENVPFKVPDSWVWCRLCDVFDIVMGQSPDGTSVSDINANGLEFHQGKTFFTEKYISTSNVSTTDPNKIAPANSVLLCVRAPVGTVNITTRRICIGRGLCAIYSPSNISIDFIYFWLSSLSDSFNEKATGSTFTAISSEIVRNELLSLPPFEEQLRIVNKIKEIFLNLSNIEDSLS